MAQQTINLGTIANDGTGDTLRDGGDKINDNFTELYAGLVGLFDPKGSTDCSANPNYPVALKGDVYLVSVAGKIGGASGKVVSVGDLYIAFADNAGGTEASVGTSWSVVQGNVAYDPVNKAGDTMSGELVVPAEVYGVGWNGSNEVPTKNDVYDKIEAVVAGAGSVSDAAYGGGWNGDTTTAPSKNAVYDKIEAVVAGAGVTSLDDVGDVNAPTPGNGEVLTWDSTPGEWVSSAPAGGASDLDDLGDVNAPSPADGDVLTFDSGAGEWIAAAPTGGGGGATPTVRSSRRQQWSGASASDTITLPTGTIAGDVVIAFAGTAFPISSASAGWLLLNASNHGNYNGAVYAKVMTAGDISTGTVTITASGAFDGVTCLVTLDGSTVGGQRCPHGFVDSAAGATTAVTAHPAAEAGDLIIGFATNRATSTNTLTFEGASGTTLQSAAAANASTMLASITAAPGALGVTGAAAFSSAGSGYYLALVAFRG